MVMRWLTLILVAAAALASGDVPRAQVSPRAPAWFGLALPPGLGDPHKPVVNVSTATPPSVVLPAGEPRVAEFEGAAIRKDLESIIGFSKESRGAGNRVWGRITGFPSAVAVMNWTAQQFRSAGLTNVQVQQYAGTGGMWWSKSWEVRLLGDPSFGAGTAPVVLESAIPTSGSQIAGGTITAPLVSIGATESEIPANLDVKGKVAVQHLKPASGAYSERTRTSTRAREMMARGAVAVINVVEQIGNMHVRDFGNCGVPCFNLGAADGAFLEGAMERAGQAGKSAELRIQLTLQSETLTGLSGQNAIGIVPGRAGENGENIIVNAHGDGWFDAAGDNGDGLAVLVAMAKHFGKPENRPERTLVFVASGGHHSSGLNGPSNVVRMNGPLTARTVLVVNLEHISQLHIRPAPWRVEPTEQPMSLGISNQSPFLIALGKRAMDRYSYRLNPNFGSGVPGDLGGYEPLGVARVQAIHSGPMYHVSGDVLETISVPGLERAARFFTYFVREAAKAPRTEINP
jgi:hypothetical protein